MDYRQLGLIPISDDAPAGENVRDTVEYEELAEEIEKRSSVHTDEGPDWAKVVDLSGRLLSKKGKDLLVASYLCSGLLALRNVEGLSESMALYADLLDTHWDGLFPPKKRMRGRVAAVEWWMDEVDRFLKTEQPKQVDAETYKILQKEVDRLQSAVQERFSDPPSLRPLLEFLNVLPVDEPEKEGGSEETEQSRETEATPKEQEEHPVPAKKQTAIPPGKTAAPPKIEQVADPTSKNDARKVALVGLDTLRKAANYCLEIDPEDPEPYRWRRIAVWARAALPPNEQGKTRIPAPEANVLTAVQAMQENGNWEALLKFAEARLSQFMFWLDLNRFADTALEALGDAYEQARQQVQQETSFFLQRLPGVQVMSFANAMPFADAETQAWLGGLVRQAESCGGEAQTTAGPEQQVIQIMAEHRKSNVVDTLAALNSALRAAPAGEQKIFCRLALIRMLAAGKKPFLAGPVVEAALDDLERHDIATWNPPIALFVLKESHAALSKVKDQEAGKRAQQVLASITRIDPAQALRMVGG